VSNNVESDSLREGTALTDGDDISVFNRERRTAVGSDVLVSLFESTVLSDIMKVVSSYNESSLHLCGNDLSRQNSSSDGDVSSEGALLVDEISLNGGIGGLNSETNVLHKANGLLADGSNSTFAGNKNCILLLVGLFVLVALDVILCYANHIFYTYFRDQAIRKRKKLESVMIKRCRKITS